jgi:hypothetical protein
MKHLLLSLALLLAATASAAPPAPSYAFTHGRWWNGTGYDSKTVYSIDGRLRTSGSGRVDETVDLGNRFVIPPLAEGHNHWLEVASVDEYTACYLADGVFYVKDFGNSPYFVEKFRDRVNLPNTVDFITALQGFTGPGGHPVEITDQLAGMGLVPKEWAPAYDPQAMFVVTTVADVDARFKILVRENPAFVKVFLLFSEEYEKRLNDPAMRGNHRGMDPKLLPEVVKLAHAAGLKVAAHIQSAADFRTAVDAGVDDIAHMPGPADDPIGDMRRFVLTEADAARAAERHVRVTTTLQWLENELPKEQPDHAREFRDRVAIPNLKVLKSHGVTILVGSDQFRHSPLNELFVLRDLGMFTNAELLKIATETTTAAIFPNRKLGRLEEGYEANFLVLDKDPVESFDNIRTIHLRVKQGRRLLTLPESALKRKGYACFGEDG